MKINIQHVPPHRFLRTVLWAVFLSAVIVSAAAGLGRAAKNFKAALSDKPDVALYLLLPDENITTSTVIRDLPTERDYIANTASGQLFVKLKRGPQQWYVSEKETLHGARTGGSGTGTESLHE